MAIHSVQDFSPLPAYSTRMNARFIPVLAAACLLLVGCHHEDATSGPTQSPQDEATAANALFLNQKTFDPWVLTNTDPNSPILAYTSDGEMGVLTSGKRDEVQFLEAGHYQNGQLKIDQPKIPVSKPLAPGSTYLQHLDLRTGMLDKSVTTKFIPGVGFSQNEESTSVSPRNLNHLWQTSDIIITGDPESQQVTHANLFYLLSSTYPGSNHSIPPFGLSSNLYGGHIFWDAEVFMLPALIVQHPEYAKPIIDYRFKLLEQAKKNAAAHGFAGAEYPWESADTGKEMVGAEFAKERHITADVGWAAWQYYLWTGDKNYLKTEGWPILSATAAYWVSRVSKGAEGKYHVKDVLGPDETGGVVDDDAWTNGVVQANLRAATDAARSVGQTPDPRWAVIADRMYFPEDVARGIPAENSNPMTDRFSAKQADALLQCYPLQTMTDPVRMGKMLDFYDAHTIKNGPAMTASMETIVAARLGRGQASLDLFHDSYRPFMRGPWDAFAEKRTSNRVYFCTGMGGCLQSILYGFAGLNLVEGSGHSAGTKIAGNGEVSLYAAPHLPPGWGGLTLKGINFRGRIYDVVISPGNKVKVNTHEKVVIGAKPA